MAERKRVIILGTRVEVGQDVKLIRPEGQRERVTLEAIHGSGAGTLVTLRHSDGSATTQPVHGLIPVQNNTIKRYNR